LLRRLRIGVGGIFFFSESMAEIEADAGKPGISPTTFSNPPTGFFEEIPRRWRWRRDV
jgi:hypothetical protein